MAQPSGLGERPFVFWRSAHASGTSQRVKSPVGSRRARYELGAAGIQRSYDSRTVLGAKSLRLGGLTVSSPAPFFSTRGPSVGFLWSPRGRTRPPCPIPLFKRPEALVNAQRHRRHRSCGGRPTRRSGSGAQASGESGPSRLTDCALAGAGCRPSAEAALACNFMSDAGCSRSRITLLHSPPQHLRWPHDRVRRPEALSGKLSSDRSNDPPCVRGAITRSTKSPSASCTTLGLHTGSAACPDTAGTGSAAKPS